MPEGNVLRVRVLVHSAEHSICSVISSRPRRSNSDMVILPVMPGRETVTEFSAGLGKIEN